MGTCTSTSADQISNPVKAVKVSNLPPEPLFKAKHKFPPKDSVIPHGATANGRITDLVIKNKELREMEYSDFYQRIQKMKTGKFTDEDFPADDKSVGIKEGYSKVEWKRPEQFLEGDLRIFEGNIEPKDVKQGRLGNCYLMSAIMLISQHPEIIKRLFQQTEINALGMYGVWLCVDGEWKTIIIDDFIPTENSRSVFSRNNGLELWVILLQKAYAKAYGSYAHIEKGLVGHAMNALTGAPYEYFQKDSKNRDPKSRTQANQMWQFIQNEFKQGFFLAGSSECNDRNSNLNLIAQHAYSIIQTAEVTVKKKKGDKVQRLLKLANPWGEYEWTGNWSDKSDLWTKELREKYLIQQADDGNFWMSLQDFYYNFGQVCSTKWSKNYLYSYAKLKFPPENRGFKGVFLNINLKTKGFISLTQKDHRLFNEDYRYGLVRMIVLQINSTTRNIDKYITDMMDSDKETIVEISVEPGEYYIAVQTDWNCEYSRDLVVSFYGEHGVQLLEDKQLPQSYDSFLNEIILVHQQFTEKQRIHEYASDINIKRVTGSIAGYVYYHYKNDSKEDRYLCETVMLKQKKFINVTEQEETDKFSVKIMPGQEKIVKLRVSSQGNGYYSYSTKIQFYIVEGYTLEKLRDLCNKKPTKTKKREIEGKPIDVIVKTFSYSGGIALLYQNKMDKYAFVEEITLQIQNLELENATMNKKNQIEIELEPQTQRLLSFVVSKPGIPVVFRTTMSFYLNSPEFKF